MSERSNIKSAYELAMERLARQGDVLSSLTEEQKSALAEVARQTKARIAEKEILYRQRLAEAEVAGDAEKAARIADELRMEIAKMREREEAEKKRIRDG